MAYHSQQRSVGGSSTQPPSYRPQNEYRREQHLYQDDDEDDYMAYEATHRPASTRFSAAPADSSRAITHGETSTRNARGMSHGASHPPLETPSAYSDPYEYSATGRYANVTSTRPEHDYLVYDPYETQQRQSYIGRSDTLLPGDSVSAYNVDARSRDIHIGASRSSVNITRPLSYHPGPDGSQDFKDASYVGGHHPYGMSSDEMPLRNHPMGMGYADDEYQEQQQRDMNWDDYPSDEKWDQKHAPSLFANNLPDQQPLPVHEMEKEADDRRNLLSRFSPSSRKGPKPGWGGTLDEQIARRKKGIGRQRWPILTWLTTIAYIAVFIAELIQAKQKTGQAIQTTPAWNPMIGPSFEFLISYGARFVPCMRKVPDIPTTTEMACLQYSTLSTLSEGQLCPIWQICGLPNADTTNQAYRFVAPIFVHAGFVHILFNLMVQLTLCAQIENLISTPFYALVYFAGGIGGNLLGANFGLVGQPSVGASGAIYTCISAELIDLCYNWKYEYRPRTRLIVSVVFAIVGFVIGLLPGLDNFAHIGGFAVGTLGGLLFCPAIHATKRHRIITWALRIISAGLLVGFFVGLTTNFYSSADPTQACRWCRYLSCLPTFSQCKGNGLTMTTTTSSPSSR